MNKTFLKKKILVIITINSSSTFKIIWKLLIIMFIIILIIKVEIKFQIKLNQDKILVINNF